MSETAGTREGPDMGDRTGGSESPAEDDGTGMDARSAAAIMREASEHATSELAVNGPLLLGCAGLAYLLSYGTVWLAVRGQHPYAGPPGWALGVLVLLVLTAIIVTAAVLNRAVSGIGGQSMRRRRVTLVSIGVALVAVFAIEAGLRGTGASIGTVDMIGASGPILVAGLAMVGAAPGWQHRSRVGLGAWLIALAIGAPFAGAAAMWGIDAVAGCAGYLVSATIEFRLGRA
jgi:hypothetical protein